MIITGDFKVRLAKVLNSSKWPSFLACIDASSQMLNLHTCAAAAPMQADIEKLLEAEGISLKVSVHSHRRRTLANPGSLERLVEMFRGQEVVFDPTLVHARATALVETARRLRAQHQSEIKGFFFEPVRRLLVVHLKRDLDPQRSMALATEVERTLRGASLATAAPTSAVTDAPVIDVRIVSTLPNERLVPVDFRSTTERVSWRHLLRGAFVSLISTGLAVGTAAAHSATDRGASANGAVSGFGVIGSLSVFADDHDRIAQSAFAAAGLQLYFGGQLEDGAGELQMAQGNSNLRIVVTPDPTVEDGPELKRPSWATPHTAGAGPGS